MCPHRPFGNTKLAGNLLAALAPSDPGQDFPLALGECPADSTLGRSGRCFRAREDLDFMGGAPAAVAAGAPLIYLASTALLLPLALLGHHRQVARRGAPGEGVSLVMPAGPSSERPIPGAAPGQRTYDHGHTPKIAPAGDDVAAGAAYHGAS